MFKPTITNVLFVLGFKEMTKTKVNIYKINKMHMRIKMYVKIIHSPHLGSLLRNRSLCHYASNGCVWVVTQPSFWEKRRVTTKKLTVAEETSLSRSRFCFVT